MSSHQVNRTTVQGLRGLFAGALGAVFLAALSGSGPVWSAPPTPNIGEPLFREQTWPAVILNLDRLQQLGVRGVKVAVKYPVLIPSFPRSADYLEFYRRVGQEVRRRNLKS